MPNRREPREPQPALGAAIRQLRVGLPLTQEELASRSQLHSTWISHIERGGNPEWATVKRIAKGLEVTMLELVTVIEQIELE